MDEKGCMIGQVRHAKVLVQKGARPVQIQDGNREMVTVLECVSADGSSICPTYIFQGKYILSKWKENDPIHAHFAVSENGWTNSDLCLDWLCKVFEPETAEKAGGNPCLLIWDGHVSHVTYEAVVFARDHNISMLCLPLHATAILQPLDKVLFGPLSKNLSEEIEKASVAGQPAQKEDFPSLQGKLHAHEHCQLIQGHWPSPINPFRIKLSKKLPTRINEVGLPLRIDPFTQAAAQESGEIGSASEVSTEASRSPRLPHSTSFEKIKSLIDKPAKTEEAKQYQAALSIAYNKVLGSSARELLTNCWASKINNAAHAQKDGSQRRIGTGTATILTDEAYIQEQKERQSQKEKEQDQKQKRKTDRECKQVLKQVQDDLRKMKQQKEQEERKKKQEEEKLKKAEEKARKA